MRTALMLAAIAASMSIEIGPAIAQSEPELALNNPDKLAWVLFLKVNADAKSADNNNALFETWASDGDTFQPTPAWPTTRGDWALPRRAHRASDRRPHPEAKSAPLAARWCPGRRPPRRRRAETNRRLQLHRPDNDLYKVSGLKAAYAAGKITFPIDRWRSRRIGAGVRRERPEDVNAIPGYDGDPNDAAKLYHVNRARTANAIRAGLDAHHLKAGAELDLGDVRAQQQSGALRLIGCKEASARSKRSCRRFPLSKSKQHYPDCVKTTELAALFAHANLDPAYANYCLKGSQSDFTDATGLAIRLGNSVTEKSFVDQASCITCHGRAAVDQTGKMTTFAGFGPISINLPLTQNAGNAPVGPIDPNWFWVPGGPPSFPVLANEADISRIAMAVDFVWSIAFCAIDDTANPPQTTSRFCANK